MKSGKSFGAMNMDEFLANLWPTIEENDNGEAGAKPTVLPHQGSLLVAAPLCKKTVKKFWFEMQSGVQQPLLPTSAQNSYDEDICRQQTLGDITLEDFLVKAGVVQKPHWRRRWGWRVLIPVIIPSLESGCIVKPKTVMVITGRFTMKIGHFTRLWEKPQAVWPEMGGVINI